MGTQSQGMSLQNEQSRYYAGIALMLASGLGFAAMNLFIRLAGPDIPSVQKSFFRNLVVFFVALFFVSRDLKGRKKIIRTKSEGFWLVMRSLFGLVGVLANFYAVDHIPIANASVLNKLSPFFTIIFAAIFLKEKVNKVQVISIFTAFVGVLILSKPEAGAMAEVFPTLIAVVGGVAAGAAYTSVRYLTMQGTSGSVIVLFFAAFSCVALLPSLLLNFVPMTGQQWLYMFLLGIGAAVGQYAITFAYKFAAPSRISIFDYSMVIFAMVLGMLFLDQYPDFWSLLGSAIVFFAFLMMFTYNRVLARRSHRKHN